MVRGKEGRRGVEKANCARVECFQIGTAKETTASMIDDAAVDEMG